MNTTKIIITNILTTNTAFAVLQEDYTENVFIPAKVFLNSGADIGDVVDALLVPNMQHHDKTPWLAARIIAQPVAAVQSSLRERIIAHLQEYDATVQELASNLGGNESDIEDALTDLARDGYLVFETVYSLKGAA